MTRLTLVSPHPVVRFFTALIVTVTRWTNYSRLVPLSLTILYACFAMLAVIYQSYFYMILGWGVFYLHIKSLEAYASFNIALFIEIYKDAQDDDTTDSSHMGMTELVLLTVPKKVREAHENATRQQ